MTNTGTVVALNISEQKGTIKHSITEAVINEQGMVGDAHAGLWHRQISLLGADSVANFSKQAKREIKPGEFAENITLDGIDLNKVAILDRFKCGKVELEVTQIGKTCHGDKCAIYQEVGNCIMPKEGIFCRVIHGGKISQGDEIIYKPRPLTISCITLSDRASQGVYEDRSGPAAVKLIEEFFAPKRWHVQIRNQVLPDDDEQLTVILQHMLSDVDVVFTLGGTGVGARDIAPEVVSEVCDKLIPGIMENIRLKYGATKPNALLSRSVAGIAQQTQIYALPGSVKAVTEYLNEILPLLEHIIRMLHNIDVH